MSESTKTPNGTLYGTSNSATVAGNKGPGDSPAAFDTSCKEPLTLLNYL